MTLHTDLWGWPQWTMIIVIALSTVSQIGLHGKPRVGTYNGVLALLGNIGIAMVLASGGFFK